jgi:hypothetical protein
MIVTSEEHKPRRYVVKAWSVVRNEYESVYLYAYSAEDATVQACLEFAHQGLKTKTVHNVEPWRKEVHGVWPGEECR